MILSLVGLAMTPLWEILELLLEMMLSQEGLEMI